MSFSDDKTDERGDGGRPPRRERGVVLFADPAGSLIRAGDEALDEESLPVLTAFRQFLEAERRRARRQMAALVAVCLLVLAGAAGGGAWYLRAVLRRVENDFEAGQVRNEEARLAAVSNLQGVARATVTLKREMLDTRQTSRILQDRVAVQNDELSKLLDTITMLEIQNSMMHRTLRQLDEPRTFRAPEPSLELRAAPEPPLPGPESRVSLTVPPPRAEEPAAPPTGITPGGVPYRLPLPRD